MTGRPCGRDNSGTIEKLVTFEGYDRQGPHIFPLETTSVRLIKLATALHPDIQGYINKAKPVPGKTQMLIDALGAAEYWGQNVNGDLFPETALEHDGPDYGAKTFELYGHPFKHHVNKDPSRAFGQVEVATWNPKMHRVELVVYLDREKCKRFDAYDIIERIERGEFPDVSMGCKVPYDVCSICQHKSKTPKDYCHHAKNMMNVILPDGRKVFVYNPRPRFFDISFVFIGADKTAKVMAKLASKGGQVCLGEYCTVPRLSADVGAMFSKEASFDGLGHITAQLDGRIPSMEEWQKSLSKLKKVEKRASDKSEMREPNPPDSNLVVPGDLDTGPGLYDPTFNDFIGNKTHTQLVRETAAAKPAFEARIFPPSQLETNSNYDSLVNLDAGTATKVANDPVKKFIHVQGIPIMLEWLKGQTRKYKSGYAKLMKADYGYIPKTMDSDGEQLDVYVGPKKDSELVFIINQLKDDGSHDERKVMIGYQDEEAAKKSYLDHMPKNRLGSISRSTIAIFKKNHLVDARLARSSQNFVEKTASASCDCHGLGDDCGGTAEALAHAVFPGVRNSEKSASHKKLSELIKSIPAGPFSKETLPKLERGEREIPKETLDRMGEMDLNHALSTPAMMGIVLKPREFQRVMLVRIGEKSLADELDSKGEVFGPSSEVDDSLSVSPDRIHHLLKELLQAMGLFRDRSAASTPLARRMERLKADRTDPKQRSEKTASRKEPVLAKLAAAYNGYRRNIVKKAAAIEQYLVSDPQLATEMFGGSMAQAFAGGIGKTASTSVFSPDSLAYLTGAYHMDRDIHLADAGVRTSLAQTGALAEVMF